MNECDKILLDSLSCYMNDLPLSAAFDNDTAENLIRRSKEQKVLAIVFLKNSAMFQNTLPPAIFMRLKTEVLFSTTSQIQRSVELVRVVSLLKNNGISSIVFKGAVCRQMYEHSEFRISSDEDLLVGSDNIEKASQILQNNGYKLLEEKNGEIKLVNTALKSILELHSSIISGNGNDEFEKIGNLFVSQLDNPDVLNTDNGEIYTFSPTYGFLSLCIHFFNHFVRGGIGIRPIMDIACFIKTYKDEIDFEMCFSILERIKAKTLMLTVISLCKKHFGIDSDYSENEKAVEELLDDVMNAGVYGTSDEGRVHSATVTRSLAKEDTNIIKSVFSAFIPSKKKIVYEHPELEGNNKEINKYRVKRIIGFAGKKGKFEVLKSTGKRNKLLKELEII